MLNRILVAILLAIVVALACMFVAMLLSLMHIEAASAVAGFLNTWGAAIGILAGLYRFAKG